tara:strand:+ start:140 stop:907 length:768 start_codon:yes stop_codon:yes gene_type:complete
MFEGATITKANPADFSFNVPLTVEKDESPVVDLLSELNSGQLTSFDMYVETGSAVFKLTNAVITSGSFDINPRNQFTLQLQGEGTKLERVGDESYSIPGNLANESATRTPLLVYPVVSIDSLDMNNIISTTLTIENEVDWTAYSTLQKSLNVTNASNIMRPSNYTVNNRTISGAVRQYQTDNNITQFDDFSTTSNITIKAIRVGDAANATPFLQLNLNPATFTARMETGETFAQSYDFRNLDNSTTVPNIITQYS